VRWCVGLLVVVLVGCGPPDESSTSLAPVNACAGTTGVSCAAFPGNVDGGVFCGSTGPSGVTNACQVSASSDYVLVVSVPQLAPVGGGTTYAITAAEITTSKTDNPCGNVLVDAPASDVCYKLATPQAAYGEYLIEESVALEAERNLGNVGGDAVSLPVSVTFWPRWTAPGTTSAIDARLLNLPLPPVGAGVGYGLADAYIYNKTLAVVPPGMNNSERPIEWIAALAPSASAPGYVGIVEVSAPFNDGYPDLNYALTIGSSQTTSTLFSVELGLGTTTSPTAIAPYPAADLEVQRTDGTALPAGWTVYYRDSETLQALTSRATLDGKKTSVRLNEINTQLVTANPNAELVVLPPADVSGSPTLIDKSGAVVENYPVLPPLVHVSGTVLSPDGTAAVSATVLFFTDTVDAVTDCQAGGKENGGILQYEALVRTADQITQGGAVGTFSVDLPQGSYVAIVDPTLTSGYAKLTNADTPVRINGTPVCSGASPQLEGVALHAGTMVVLTGSAVTADGRELANAGVDFTPAAALAPNRYAIPTFASSEDAWPRPFTTTTGIHGEFTVQVDPFAEYDMTVRPQDGSGYPWLVRPDHSFQLTSVAASVGASSKAVVLESVTVPAPNFLSVTLHDVNETPISSAVVQAYAFNDGVALPIGEAIADANGHFTMMLTTSFDLK